LVLRFADILPTSELIIQWFRLSHGQSEVPGRLFLESWSHMGISIHGDGKRRVT